MKQAANGLQLKTDYWANWSVAVVRRRALLRPILIRISLDIHVELRIFVSFCKSKKKQLIFYGTFCNPFSKHPNTALGIELGNTVYFIFI